MDILVFAFTVVLLTVLIAACLLPVGTDSPDDLPASTRPGLLLPEDH